MFNSGGRKVTRGAAVWWGHVGPLSDVGLLSDVGPLSNVGKVRKQDKSLKVKYDFN